MPLKLVRRKGSPQWYIRGSVRGQAAFETTGTDDRAAAEAIRIKRESQLLDRSVFGSGASLTFLEAAVSYIAEGGESRFLGREDPETGEWSLLIGRFMRRALGGIGQAEIDDAALALYPNAKPATRKRCVYVPMCSVLNHAARKGWIARPMISHPKVKSPVTVWSTPERLTKLLPHLKPRERRLVLFMAYTGARLSEALRLDWDRDVRLSDRIVILWRTKTKMRTLHVPDPLLVELAAVPACDRHGPLFDYRYKTGVYYPLRVACRRAGVDYLPTHQQGRHTFATWLRLYAGMDLVGLKEAGGWESIKSVERYAHVVPGEAAAAVDRLPGVQNPCISVRAVRKRLKAR
jgi:integrase